jgi:hypothetical protein
MTAGPKVPSRSEAGKGWRPGARGHVFAWIAIILANLDQIAEDLTARLTPKFREDIREIAELASDD